MIAPIVAIVGLATFVTGGYLVNEGNLWGVLVVIVGLFLFVMGFASSFPQSVSHAREDLDEDEELLRVLEGK